MARDFATSEPAVTDSLTLAGYLGSSVDLWAYSGHVVMETKQREDEADCHMTIAEAMRLRANLDATIAAAELLALGDEPHGTVIPIVMTCARCPVDACLRCPRRGGAVIEDGKP